MAVIKTISINLTARSEAFDRKVGRSSKKVNTLRRDVQMMNKSLQRMAGAFAAVVGVRALAGFVNNARDAIDITAKLSDRLNIATEDLIGLRHAADIMGSSSAAMDKSLEMFVRRLGEVRQGTGEAKRALEELGLDVNKLVDKSPAEAFSIIADEINKMGNQSDKAAAAYQLFGRAGTQLLNTLSLGSEGLKEMRDDAESLGQMFTRLDAAKVEEANDAITRARKAFGSIVQTLTIKLAPALEAISNNMTKIAGNIRNLSKSFLDSAKSIAIASLKMTAFLMVAKKAATVATILLGVLGVTGGPAGWIALAAGIGTATFATKKLSDAFKDLGKDIDDALDIQATGINLQIAKLKKHIEELKAIPGSVQKVSATAGTGMLSTFGTTGFKFSAANELIEAQKELAKLIEKRDTQKQLQEDAEMWGELSDKIDKYNTKLQKQIDIIGKTDFERMEIEIRALGEGLNLTADQQEDFNRYIEESINLAREYTNAIEAQKQAVEEAAAAEKKLAEEQRAREARTSKIEAFVQGLVKKFETPAQKFMKFWQQLDEALKAGKLSMELYLKAFQDAYDERWGLGKFADDPLVADSSDSRGESRAIRSAFVNVAGLSMQGLNPQVQEQRRTNTLMEQNNRLLTSIDNNEGIR